MQPRHLHKLLVGLASVAPALLYHWLKGAGN
jgi:hypothetical protein